MTPTEYLKMLDARRQELTGIARTWADFNMALEALQVRPTHNTAEMAAADCRTIIADLEGRPQTQDIVDALEVKRNELAWLEKM